MADQGPFPPYLRDILAADAVYPFPFPLTTDDYDYVPAAPIYPNSLLFQEQQTSDIEQAENDTIDIKIANSNDNAPSTAPPDHQAPLHDSSPHGSFASLHSDEDALHTPASNFVGGNIPELSGSSSPSFLTVPPWDTGIRKHSDDSHIYPRPSRSTFLSIPPHNAYRDPSNWSPASLPSPYNSDIMLGDNGDDIEDIHHTQPALLSRRHSHSGSYSTHETHPRRYILSNNSSPGPLVNGLSNLRLDDVQQQSESGRYNDGPSSMSASMNGPQQATGTTVTIPFVFGANQPYPYSFLTSYAPPPPFPQPSLPSDPRPIQAPVTSEGRGGTLRRRGPDANSIRKRTKNGKLLDSKLFCEVDGCRNLGFATPATLRRHTKDKHSGIKHLCSVCSRSYADSTSVSRHERDAHGIQPPPRRKHE